MKTKTLYLISFIEGGIVMVTEIAGAKLLSPFFGASIYSWASTLSITLLALMSGYYAGGYLTTKPKFQSIEKIVWVFLLSGSLVMLMPSFANFIMTETISLSFFTGLIISQLFFLFAPIFLMAMISPMIIYQLTKKAEESGKLAGSIYALSTSGGIIFTLLFGFFIIPEYGISIPVEIIGLCVSILALALLISQKFTSKKIVAGVIILLLAGAVLYNRPGLPSLEKMTIVDRSEGLLGLRVNNVTQNSVLAENPSQSLLYYVNFTQQLLTAFPEKKSALLVGLGAGSLYRIMSGQYKEVTSVELDKRIYDYGVRYFGMAEHDNVIDDGRHYINTCNSKFDLIMIDVIVGENVPGQVISLESFSKCHEMLTENGIMIIENGAVHDFEHNSFAPSIVKTLEAAGFQVSLFNPIKSNQMGDILFIATKNAFNYSNIYMKDDITVEKGPASDYALSINVFDVGNAKLLTDDRNYTDKLLLSHYLATREITYINHFKH
jgi:predicted membrane-bound spermidine synthase